MTTALSDQVREVDPRVVHVALQSALRIAAALAELAAPNVPARQETSCQFHADHAAANELLLSLVRSDITSAVARHKVQSLLMNRGRQS